MNQQEFDNLVAIMKECIEQKAISYGKIKESFNDAKFDFLCGDSLVAREVTRAMIGKHLTYQFGDYVTGVDDTLKRLAQQENLKYISSVLDTLCASSTLESFSVR